MKALIILMLVLFCAPPAISQSFETDIIKTSKGDLEIHFIGHGTLMLTYGGKIIHVDPFSRLADYSKLPQADAIFLTHHHRDHLDSEALRHVRTENTTVILTEICAKTVEDGIVMKNGDVRDVMGIRVEAVPAYNIKHQRENGNVYHPKGKEMVMCSRLATNAYTSPGIRRIRPK